MGEERVFFDRRSKRILVEVANNFIDEMLDFNVRITSEYKSLAEIVRENIALKYPELEREAGRIFADVYGEESADEEE